VRGEGSTGTIAAFGTYAVGFLARPLARPSSATLATEWDAKRSWR
jgi:hypothetical protein